MTQDAVDQVHREEGRLLAGNDDAKILIKTPLWRACLFKETLGNILGSDPVNVVRDRLQAWTSWDAHSRLAPFKKLAATIRYHIEGDDEVWKTYSLLTRVEAAFRSMKRTLAECPFFRHLKALVQTHIRLCVLACHLLVAIELTLN